jgi:hypothetical protein
MVAAMFHVSSRHPLSRLFHGLAERSLFERVGLCDPQLASYLGGLLVRFTHVDNVYRIRDARGRRLEDVGEMLLESNPMLSGASFDREREIRRHVGDYTLFFTGLFPESLERLSRSLRLDYFVDYVEAGKESYYIVSQFTHGAYEKEAPLFRKLSDLFGYCVVALNYVRSDLENLRHPYYSRIASLLN